MKNKQTKYSIRENKEREVKEIQNISKILILTTICILFLSITISNSYAIQPSAPDAVNVVSNLTRVLAPGYMLNNSGGSILNIDFNATMQNYRWKAFVGKINGKFALRDDLNNTLISWDINNITGEIYATRNSSIPNWNNIQCANEQIIQDEELFLNHISNEIDSIKSTFNKTIHKEFYVGSVKISKNSCRAIALNVNNTAQETYFQETLLSDGTNLIYASLLENSVSGFNSEAYDFQMIVAENALLTAESSTPYYIYIELI